MAYFSRDWDPSRSHLIRYAAQFRNARHATASPHIRGIGAQWLGDA